MPFTLVTLIYNYNFYNIKILQKVLARNSQMGVGWLGPTTKAMIGCLQQEVMRTTRKRAEQGDRTSHEATVEAGLMTAGQGTLHLKLHF